MLSGLAKVGYILVGAGIGIFGSSFILAYEFDKPVGEIEEFIPESEDDNEDNQDDGPEGDEVYSQNGQEGSSDIRNGRDGRGDSVRRGREGQDAGSGAYNGGEETHQEFQSNQTQILDYYKSPEGSIRDRRKGRHSKAKSSKAKDKSSKRSKRRKEFDKMREESNANLGTRYSKMFDADSDSTDKDMTDILHEVSSKTDTKDSYSQYKVRTYQMDEWVDDGPSDDSVDDYPPGEVDIYDEYNLERVEDNIEIYLDDNPNDFATLVWYQGDQTLCDDGEQIIPNPEEVIGEVAISRLLEGGPGADDGVIFVRNLKTCINYEVVLDMGCYSETVIGTFEARQSRLNNGGGKGGSS